MLSIEQVNVPRAADVLANLLREKIFRGELLVGTDLPPERELGELAGVSRATVREALRLLESDGLLVTRVGRNGGSEVVRPTVEAVEHSLNVFIRSRHIRHEAILEARAAIEGPSAQYAALHRTDADLSNLEVCHERLERASRDGDIQGYIRANLDWHVRVVRASHNELLDAFITAIAQPIFAASDLKDFNSLEIRTNVVRAHQGIMDAIRDRDGDSARRRMDRHVGAYIEAVSKLKPQP